MPPIPITFVHVDSGAIRPVGEGDVGDAVAGFLGGDLHSPRATQEVLDAIAAVRAGERASWTNTFDENEIIIGRDVSQIGFLWAEQFQYVEVETPQLAAAVRAWQDVMSQADNT